MANTYTQYYIQTVFPVKYRQALIIPEVQHEFFGVIGKEINKTGCKTYIVNGTEDHVHLLFGLPPTKNTSEVLKMVKGNSSKWMNDSGIHKKRFQWQQGYGGFSYSKKEVPRVYQYILNQKEHHRKRDFFEEYIDFLNEHEIEYHEGFIFKPLV